MGIVNRDEIRGVKTAVGGVLCSECMGDVSDYKESDFLLANDVEGAEELYYCDECKEAL